MCTLNSTFTNGYYFYIINLSNSQYPALVVYDMRNGQPVAIIDKNTTSRKLRYSVL